MRPRLRTHPALCLAFGAIGAATFFVFTVATLGVHGSTVESLANNWVYMAAEFVAIAVCGARCLTRRDHRLAWGLMTLALGCWSVGDLLWALWLDHLTQPPFPSPADLAYLLMYPAMYGTLMLMIRTRLRHVEASQWLDGGVMALAVGAVAAALVFSNVLGSSRGGFDARLVTIAYPVGDFILLMLVVLAFTLSGGRPGRDWLALGTGVTLMAVADIVYVNQVADGTFVDGTLLNGVYLLSFALLAAAAWMRPRQATASRSRAASHTIVLPVAAALIALSVLLLAAFTTITPLAVALAASSLIFGILRSVLTYLENVRMLVEKSREAATDALTGLGNRRRLISDLEVMIERSRRPATLVFFDLNGFKRYNDSFGHLAGDALLARLASALQLAVAGHGSAYRLGGDEFTVLLDGRYPRTHALIESATSALTEHGRGFDVTTAVGLAILPDEATTADAALRLTDERMYIDKGRAYRAPTRDVLMQLLTERTPDLHEHVSGVTELAAAVAHQLGLNAEEVDETLRAAELHDVGKLAIPDRILDKPGPLDPVEWEFMKQHPVIGHRILSAAPALAPVAALVRASHERWGGGGYPDGISGEEIPLGSRIIAVCDALDAMTSERCYQGARTWEEAVDELKRCAGTQFDPAVVDAVERCLLAHPSQAAVA